MRRKQPEVPVPLDLTQVSEQVPLLNSIPLILRDEGRVKGFEALRDILLTHAEKLGPILAVIKTILETDRHALFAQVALDKQKNDEANKQWDYYKRYLKGEVNVPFEEDLGIEAAHARPQSAEEDNG